MFVFFVFFSSTPFEFHFRYNFIFIPYEIKFSHFSDLGLMILIKSSMV